MAVENSNVTGTSLHWPDIVVLAFYFAFVLIVGMYSSYRSKRSSINGYYLASRNLNWIPVGASLFASNIGSGHFIGLAGAGAKSGIAISSFEIHAMFILILLGWVFVPVYITSGIYTLPEYMRKRFGGQRIRVYLSVLAIILYVFTKISVDLFAGALFIKQSLDFDLYSSIIVLLIVAGLFTICGGLSAVIWTDFVQTILMVIGAFILMLKSFAAVGGYHELTTRYMDSKPSENVTSYNVHTNESCSAVIDDAMHIFRSPYSDDLPWTGITLGLTVSAVWYWCSDQVIVQRALAAKNLSHAKGGTLLAGVLKILPLYLLVFPGMAARVLFPDKIACSTAESCEEACGSKSGCTNIAYPLLVINLMPPGLSGLMLSVMIAALMSSLTSVFNSSSTIFAIDIWTRIRKNASEFEILLAGRLFVVILVIISILWIPIIEVAQGSQLFHYIQSIQSFLAPPICAVTVLAVLWGRINEQGAFWGLMVGLVIGLTRFGWEYSYTVPPCGSHEPDPRPYIISKVHYLHFGVILFVVVCIVTTVVSLLTRRIPEECLHRMTFSSRFSREIRREIDDVGDNDGATDEIEMDDVGNGKATDDRGGTQIDKDYGATTPNSFQSDCKEKKPWHLRVVYFLCGFEQSESIGRNSLDKTHEQQLEDLELIIERPMWIRLEALFAVLLGGVGIFMFAYYA